VLSSSHDQPKWFELHVVYQLVSVININCHNLMQKEGYEEFFSVMLGMEQATSNDMSNMHDKEDEFLRCIGVLVGF
jgi:hypothetical protein